MTLAFDPKIGFMNGFTPKPLLNQVLADKSFSALAGKRKIGTSLRDHVVSWMKNGSLHEMVQEIYGPSFVKKEDLFNEMLKYRNIGLLWNLLTFDMFQNES